MNKTYVCTFSALFQFYLIVIIKHKQFYRLGKADDPDQGPHYFRNVKGVQHINIKKKLLIELFAMVTI